MAMTEVNPERQRMLDYLSNHGLVPQNIKHDGWDATGFLAVNPITGNTSFEHWPPGFNFDWFAKLIWVADIADMRRAGLRVPQVVR